MRNEKKKISLRAASTIETAELFGATRGLPAHERRCTQVGNGETPTKKLLVQRGRIFSDARFIREAGFQFH